MVCGVKVIQIEEKTTRDMELNLIINRVRISKNNS